MQPHFDRNRQPQMLQHPQRTPPAGNPTLQDSKLAPSPSDIFENDNPQVTLRYMKQYLNQVIVENCQLRSLLDQRNNQLNALQTTINEKTRDLEVLRKSKE